MLGRGVVVQRHTGAVAHSTRPTAHAASEHINLIDLIIIDIIIDIIDIIIERSSVECRCLSCTSATSRLD